MNLLSAPPKVPNSSPISFVAARRPLQNNGGEEEAAAPPRQTLHRNLLNRLNTDRNPHHLFTSHVSPLLLLLFKPNPRLRLFASPLPSIRPATQPQREVHPHRQQQDRYPHNTRVVEGAVGVGDAAVEFNVASGEPARHRFLQWYMFFNVEHAKNPISPHPKSLLTRPPRTGLKHVPNLLPSPLPQSLRPPLPPLLPPKLLPPPSLPAP